MVFFVSTHGDKIMSGPTTTSILPPAVQQQLSMKLLARPMPDLIHTTMGKE